MNTETGLALERLRVHAIAEIQAVRCDPTHTDEQKREQVSELRREHAARAWALIEESRNKKFVPKVHSEDKQSRDKCT